MSFGWGVGDILAISGLAVKVRTAYKDAPDGYRHIADEVKALQIIIHKALRHFESTTLGDNLQQEGQEVLKGCQSVLQDLDSLLEKHKILASANPFNTVKLGTEDIQTLRIRLISNTGLLNSFIQSCEFLEMQAQLNSLGLHRTNSRFSITSFTESVNAKKGFKKFFRDLYQTGVKADMIKAKETEILNIFKSQNTATSSRIDDSTNDGLLGADNDSISAKSGLLTNRVLNWFRSPFSKGQSTSTIGGSSVDLPTTDSPPVDLETGSFVPAAAEVQDTIRSISTVSSIRGSSAVDSFNRTALHLAAQSGRTSIVEQLLEKGDSIEAIDKDNHTPLHLAAQNGHTDTVELLLIKGAPIDAMGKDSRTPLHFAARNGHAGIAELLLSKGASIEALDKANNTPIHYAAWNGHFGVVELLLQKAASVQAVNKYNNTPMHYAAWSGHSGTVELLLRTGASVQAMNTNHQTPLYCAAWNGCTSTVELLLENGASIETIDNDSNTPIHHAAWGGHYDTVDLLLRKGASIEAMDDASNTPLHYAAWKGYTNIVGLLLKKGALIEAINKSKNTPLHLAALHGRLDTAKLLLQTGALIGSINGYDNTPLHLAAWHGHTNVVELCLEEGASMEAMNKDNNTPAQVAAQSGHTDTVELLISKGGKPVVPESGA